jgi:hypothetical protein
MTVITLNNMFKLISDMRSDREYLIYMLQIIRLRKNDDETFKSLINCGIKVARERKLIMMREINGDDKTDERKE